jgi:NADP-dependent 3-hydroxy acid dehydrogenase YdfG
VVGMGSGSKRLAILKAIEFAARIGTQECQVGVSTLRVAEVSPGMVATKFGDSIPDQGSKEALSKRLGDIAIPPDAIARSILFALEQPPEVIVGSIVIRPTAQD